jgi:hypothetical protein
MQRVQAMQSSCSPLRMSMPVGHTTTQRLQSMQSPAPSAFTLRARGSPRFSS